MYFNFLKDIYEILVFFKELKLINIIYMEYLN